MAKKLVRVMTPKPPICISMIMMNNPSDVNVERDIDRNQPRDTNGTGSGKQSIDKGNAMISGTRKHQ